MSNSAGIERLINIELAPEYDQRRAMHVSNRDSARAAGRAESWPVRGIDYTPGLTKGQSESITINGIKLEGMEAVLYNQIIGLLAAKERDRVSGPVVVLDFGGMYGIPFIKLAKATEDLVKQSRIVYAVSNLTFNPATMSDDEVRDWTGLYDPDYDNFFLQNRDLVHFIVSDADELRETRLELPNGESLSLYGNIDLMHEINALGKSQLLDSDLLSLGKSLSAYGTIYLGDKDAKYTVNPTAFRTGETNLLMTGVRKIVLGNYANYALYVKPKAPTLSTSSS